MATLHIHLPGQEKPTVFALKAARITIGRHPDNTIQILDRSVSGRHAEILPEGDHFLLKDRDSTNGTRVGDNSVSDYHLREDCKIRLGSIECDFESAATAETAAIETLPSQHEVAELRRENDEIKTVAEHLRKDLEAARQTMTSAGEGGETVPKAEYDRIAAERQTLEDAQQTHAHEVAALKEQLAVAQQDRAGLQNSLSEMQTVLDGLKAKAVETPDAAADQTPPQPAAPVAASPKPFAALSKPTVPGTKPVFASGPRPFKPKPVEAPAAAPVPVPRAVAKPVVAGPVARPVLRPIARPAAGIPSPTTTASDPQEAEPGDSELTQKPTLFRSVPRAVPAQPTDGKAIGSEPGQQQAG